MFTQPELEGFTRAWNKTSAPRKERHFHDSANGHPDDWNAKQRTVQMNKRLRDTWGDARMSDREYHLIAEFLRVRVSSRGKAIAEELEFESVEGILGTIGGIEWCNFVRGGVPADLPTGMHGTIPEALFSIFLECKALRHGTRTLER